MRPTVTNQVNSGNAASRSESVHCMAAQTRAALRAPLRNALAGNGTAPR